GPRPAAPHTHRAAIYGAGGLPLRGSSLRREYLGQDDGGQTEVFSDLSAKGAVGGRIGGERKRADLA
ncbi:MAG: hypothetical protein ACI9U6_003194, partial [Loktanella salsilacus]